MTELPSLQWVVADEFNEEDLILIAVNNTSDRAWLQNYTAQMGLTYPFIYDEESSLFNLFQVGGGSGNIPPSYFIVDQSGVVRYRIDDLFEQFDAMKQVISGLLQ